MCVRGGTDEHGGPLLMYLLLSWNINREILNAAIGDISHWRH